MCARYDFNTFRGWRVRSTCLCFAKSSDSGQPSKWFAMCLRNTCASDPSSVGKMLARSAGIDASTSAREGRSAPVCFKKWANKGSSTTPKSGRCAKLYIKAVLQLRGPDQRDTVMPITERPLRYLCSFAAPSHGPTAPSNGTCTDHRGRNDRHLGAAQSRAPWGQTIQTPSRPIG